MRRPLQLGILISGGGRTALNLHDEIIAGRLSAQIKSVVSSRADAVGIERLRERGIAVTVADVRTLSLDEFQRTISAAMACVDLVCMCGFLALWKIPPEFRGRVMNIHPALLPHFGGKGMYGLKVHEAVLKSGAQKSGCTVHFCDDEYDHGPNILQREVSIQAGDTAESLARRVFAEECRAYPEAVRLFSEGMIRLEGDCVTFSS